ncbi:MAG: hypothetical protein ACTSQE_15970 [Candidatus Heimdallarchaeaceae archaeon]
MKINEGLKVVLTESDFVQRKPIKNPMTLNPLGAIITGISFGEGFVLLYNSLIDKTYNASTSVLGILLLLFSIISFFVSTVLTSKSIEFFLILEKDTQFFKRILVQSLLFYLGFTPSFGFLVAYGASTISFWKYFIPILVFSSGFFILVWDNIKILRKKEARIGNLLQPTYQPNKILVLALSALPILISTLTLILIPN